METAEMTNTGFGDLTKLYQQRARTALPLLVRQAKANQTIFYSDLAAELNMPNARNLNFPLGAIGREMEKLSSIFGKPIPPIQCLVINRSDGVPGNGIGWFLKTHDIRDFKKLPPTEKRRIVDSMLMEIYGFESWDRVLEAYQLPPVSITSEEELRQEAAAAENRFGNGGESDAHRLFKEYVARNPQLFDLPSGLIGETEYLFPSVDRLDVLFKNNGEWVGVEVKGEDSDDLDITRGLFQCVKYQALLEAEQRILQQGIDCRMVLALRRKLPSILSGKRAALNVNVVTVLRG